MSKREWTDEQLSAIRTANSASDSKCNILVSAAAGSGKTAVLVERIIKKLLPEDASCGIDVSKLLVVTFTNAAAQEMKDRVNKALSDELKLAREKNDRQKISEIKRQLLLLSTADITTIDAFCLKIIRENFSILDIDPDFSIADEGQASILMEEATEELFSSLYDEKNEDFMLLMDLYASASSHRALSELLKNVYNYTRSIPYPLEWLRTKAEALRYAECQLCDTPLYESAKKDALSKIESLFNALEKTLVGICETSYLERFIEENPAKKGVEVYDNWGPAYKALTCDYLMMKKLMVCDNPATIIRGHAFSPLSFSKKVPEQDKNRIRYLRDNIKTTLSGIETDFSVSYADAQKISREEIYPVANAIYNLVSRLHDVYMEKKKNMNILEFHDIEQLTQDLFSSNPDIAENVRDRYDEILMDEYQDTSLLQEEIFSKIKKADNVFMVGDMKQSIYRFRSSDPTIFKDKIDSFSKKDDQLRRMIILSNNFRSRKEILDSINDVFSAIMSENAGELDYDDSQRLNIIEKLAAEKDPKYKSECVTISVESGDDGEDSPDKVRAEARYIASEIIRLKNDGFEISDNGNKRPIQNRDFAILLSKYKNVAEIYASELNDAGIECHAESSGYFDQSEIRLMLSLLSVISNPYSDILLIGVLRSPIASFTDDDIVTIRKCKKGKFYSALKEMSARTEKDDFHLAKKCAHFLENLARWRRYSRYMSCDKLLWTLYEETDFYAFCGAMYDGEVMQANLRLLFLRARQYEDTGFRGLFNFIKHIENLKKRDADIAAAKLIQDDRDAVRIMTIHKSKGLEMPVVFIAGGGSSFNKSQNDSRILLHKKYGLGFDHISYEHRYKTETLEKKLLKNALSKEQISEEIRKLYVAMTRAREKLYFISSFKFDELNPDACELGKKKTRWESSTEDNTVKLTPFDVLSSKCFADWVVPVARCSDDWLCLEYSSKAVSVPETATALEIPKSESDINIDAVLDFDYPHKEATMLATKVTVSQLKQSDETIMAPMPVFMSNTTNTGAFYGTAMHNFIKHIDLSGDFSIEYIESELERLGTGGVLSENEAKKINTKKIHTFFTSELGKRIQNSKRVFREQPFEVTLSADTLYPGMPNVSDESVILQGVIDCYFEEDDGLVLVDYKTDRFENSDEIRKKYALQLELYAIALEKITKKSVKNKYFYLFFDDSVIE